MRAVMKTADFAKMRAIREVKADSGKSELFTRYYDECTGELFDVDLHRRRFRKVFDLGAECGCWEPIAPP